MNYLGCAVLAVWLVPFGSANIAVNKPTKSSSVYPGTTPSRAVDGRDATNWSTGSCFAVAACDLFPWWQVDLEGLYNITQVKVTARGDCCPERFHGVAVEVFKDDPTTTPGANSQVCTIYDKAAKNKGESVTLKCDADQVEGRFVRLRGMAKMNEQDLLQFCEVKVYGTLATPTDNLALRKPTKSSSVHSNPPSRAVDGSDASMWSSGSCFAVEASDNFPWWQVDLQGFFVISEVKATARRDCCPERFHDVAVEVFKDDPTTTPTAQSQLCNMYNEATNQPGQTVTLTCGPVKGRFVKLSGKAKRNKEDLLQFCEIKVFGVPLRPVSPIANLAVNKTSVSSSVHSKPASRAVDGSTATDWSSNSCFATASSDKYPWWQVDLQARYCITKVKVTSRSDCCPERFHDVAVEVFEDDPTKTPVIKPQLCYIYEGATRKPGETVTFTCASKVRGRFFRLSGKERNDKNDLLQFCEVQVFGDHFCSW